ncbi:MAG: hypothetical protein KatS3mg104_2949 [Phycisphaerae bacterium]|nr:MAG: hypothetical protein KatS3mg104_2949 [Phycisphaerae bacterium]
MALHERFKLLAMASGVDIPPKAVLTLNVAPDVTVLGISGALEPSVYSAIASAAERIPAGKHVFMYINSPGGTVLGLSRAVTAVKSLAQRSASLTTVAGDVMASAAYWIGSTADRVIASPLSAVGSIGVINMAASMKRMLSEAGIDTAVVRSGPLKARPTMLDELDEGAVASLKRVVDSFAQRFFAHVEKERMGIDMEKIKDGAIFVGEEAVAAGLVDEIAEKNRSFRRF